MAGDVRITVLVENDTESDKLLAEHGLSVLIDCHDYRILFDTGQGPALAHNTQELGVSLTDVDALVLSHGHYDHTGGMPAVVAASPDVQIFAHPDVVKTRYACPAHHPARPVGMPSASLEVLSDKKADVVDTTRPTEIRPGLFVTGMIPRITPYEDTGGPFYLDEAGTQDDPLLDDQALWFDTEAGTVVLLGCAHAGVVNTLAYVRRLTAPRPMYAVLGGMHLGQASEDRLAHTVSALDSLDVQRLGPAHCTGALATSRLRDIYTDRIVSLGAGATHVF